MKKFILFFAVMVLAGLFCWRAEAAMSDEKFLELCGTGTAREVEKAIKGGAKVNAKNPQGLTPLIVAAFGNPNMDVIPLLIKNGADIKAKGQNGYTPLMAAALNSNPGAITALLKGGADIKAKGQNGETALMLAAAGNPNPDVITLLIKNGADVNAKAKNGETALMVAAQNNSNREIAALLIKHGADAKEYYAAYADKAADDIIDDLSSMRLVSILFRMDSKGKIPAALSVRNLRPYSDNPARFESAAFKFEREGENLWVGYNLAAGGKTKEVGDALKARAKEAELYRSKSKAGGNEFNGGTGDVWMLAHDASSGGGGGAKPAAGVLSPVSPGVYSAVAKIPNYPREYVITQNIGGLALQQYIYARLMLARLQGADAKKFSAFLNETLEAFDYADKFADKTVKYANLAAQMGKRKAAMPRDGTMFSFEFLNPFAALAAYAADARQDVQAWAENITKMFDAGTAGRQVRDLAAQLNVDAKAAYDQLKLAQDIIKKGADKSAANYDAAMKLAMATKTACKVGLFATSVIASAGGTAALSSSVFTIGEAAGIVINGVDTIVEVGQTASTIILGENHSVTAALDKASDAIAPISFATGLLTGSLDLKKLAGKTGALSLGDKGSIVGAVEFVAALDAKILNKAYMSNKDQLLYVDMNARNQEIKALQLTIPKTADGKPDAGALNETLRQE
ncbi:MAG: ankyrin repeat domain-containing protein, partial [Synergistaceae bacterium]|nr:ankyrin repeat domain-containing protein [Synergistaceae bacterium]